MTRPIVRRYRLLQQKQDGTFEDVMGGPMGQDNVYVRTYGALVQGHKPVAQLDVGERTLLRYALSGSSGLYWLERIEDGPRPEDA